MSPASTSTSAPGAGLGWKRGLVSRWRSDISWIRTRRFCSSSDRRVDVDAESRALADHALHLDRAAMELHALFHDVQADAGVLVVADVRAAVEALEEARKVRRRDAAALVGDRELQAISLGRRRA